MTNFICLLAIHDSYYKDKRDVSPTRVCKTYSRITVVDGFTEIEDVALVPWLVGDEWKKIQKMYCPVHVWSF